jgi:hypothetical protein
MSSRSRLRAFSGLNRNALETPKGFSNLRVSENTEYGEFTVDFVNWRCLMGIEYFFPSNGNYAGAAVASDMQPRRISHWFANGNFWQPEGVFKKLNLKF